jgi:predicted 3-demethylubiquinone-9 3-methyltransferase (glyoxalase superfamily)
MQKINTFLMFQGKAEEAINFYTSIFKQSQIVKTENYGPNEGGIEGNFKSATVSIHGEEYMFFDSPVTHAFTFTPAISLFVNCDSEEEITFLYEKLSEKGTVMMEFNTYPFAKKFAWLADKYGVSWQLSLK